MKEILAWYEPFQNELLERDRGPFFGTPAMSHKRKGTVASSKSKRPRAQERYEPPGVARKRSRARARSRAAVARCERAARRDTHAPRTPRRAVAPQVFSRQDSAAELNLSRDQLTVTGDKGFRMTRATHGAREGGWYWECEILHPENEKGHVRCVAPHTVVRPRTRATRARCVTRKARGRSEQTRAQRGMGAALRRAAGPGRLRQVELRVPRPPGLQAAQQRSNRRLWRAVR